MLIPYYTDAPIYYWPFATIGLIVTNFFVFCLQPYPSESFALVHGDGIYPVQWLTSIFIHGGIIHLLGNLIFLWAFGLIVEGKVGPFIFLAIYLATGVGQSAAEQLIYMNSSEITYSYGASSAIYGLVMISLIWAPQDEMKSILFFFFPVQIPIAMFGLIFCAWDFTAAVFSGFEVSTAVLHLMGAIFGVVIGFGMLITSKVDCEQRDLISMFIQLGGGKGVKKRKSRKELLVEQQEKDQRLFETQQSILKCWESMERHLRAGNTRAAADVFPKIKKLDHRQQWRDPFLFEIITQWQSEKKWDQVEFYSREYIVAALPMKNDVAINLARILVVHRERPRASIAVLQSVDVANLTEKQKQYVVEIVKRANQLIESGAIEINEQ
jgi:membrane associated rhomboid family serine protease